MICVYNLQHEGPHGGLSTEKVHSSMVEDSPTTFEHDHRQRVMRIVQGMVLGEVSF
jgi:hypothetical protein